MNVVNDYNNPPSCVINYNIYNNVGLDRVVVLCVECTIFLHLHVPQHTVFVVYCT